MVDVSNKQNNAVIKVTVSNGNTNITATADTAQYWSKQSRLSAENSKESAQESKHYAELANSYIEGFEGVVTNSTNNIITTSNDFINQITETKNAGIAEINTTKTNAVTEINKEVTDGKKELNDIIEAGGLNINDKITNCLLEVPQNIKLELADGVLTLKAGSKVIVPYGVADLTAQYPVGATFLNNNFKVAGTQYSNNQFFLWVEVQNDIKRDYSTQTWSGLVYININGNGFTGGVNSYSGATFPTTGSGFLYDTSKNIVTFYSQGVEQDYIDSLPICVATIPNSIDQVFNGFGYIGVHFWVDKGVKGLSAFGRNAGGTLNNTEFVTNRVIVGTTNNRNHYNALLLDVGTNVDVKSIKSYYADYIHKIKSRAELPLATAQNYQYYFIEDEAIWVMNGTTGVWNKTSIVEVGNLYHGADSSISDFEIKLPFRAVDYNDFNKSITALSKAYITETYVSGTSWYRIWSDGWCEQGGIQTSATVTLLKNYRDTNYTVIRNLANTSSDSSSVKVLWLTGILAITNKTTNSFNGNVETGFGLTSYMWQACGYIS